MKLSVSANGKVLGAASSAGNNQFAIVQIPLGAAWAGTIESLQITWSGPKGTTIEIDWIRIQ